MMRNLLTVIGICAALAVNAQMKPRTVVQVNSDITANTTWNGQSIYVLNGLIKVMDGVTLTIEPGCVVKGGKASDGSNATALFLQMGGRVNAIGTKEKPIIFTSGQPKGDRSYGDWGGVIIFGRAPVNKANPQYEGGVIPGTFGGNQPNDNSGTFKYCRIEFAGFPFEQDRELNSLTMCGVGRGTTIEYIQTSYNFDDAYEWFGGTVNAKYLVAFKTNDDDWDCDLGWTGNVQFGVSLADTAQADVSTKNGWEIDNDAPGSPDTPRTRAVFSNITTIGAFINGAADSARRSSLHGRGAHTRRNNNVSIFNSIFLGWREGIRMDGTTTFSNFATSAAGLDAVALDSTGFMQNNITAGHVRDFNGAGGVSASDFQTFFENAANNNRVLASASALMLTAPWRYNNPDFRPMAGSPALSGSAFTNPKLPSSFFTPTTYVGAFGQNENWMEEWTEWDPVNAEYDMYDATGLEKLSSAVNLVVYPNPSNGIVNIDFDLLYDENISVSVFDMTGKMVRNAINATEMAAGSNRISLDISDLNNGLYFVALSGNKGTQMVKVTLAR